MAYFVYMGSIMTSLSTQVPLYRHCATLRSLNSHSAYYTWDATIYCKSYCFKAVLKYQYEVGILKHHCITASFKQIIWLVVNLILKYLIHFPWKMTGTNAYYAMHQIIHQTTTNIKQYKHQTTPLCIIVVSWYTWEAIYWYIYTLYHSTLLHNLRLIKSLTFQYK